MNSCNECREYHDGKDDICENCQADTKNGYVMGYLRGRNRSGMDCGGTLTHAVPLDQYFTWGKAKCGAKPGKRSNGFARPYDYKNQVVDCPRCLAKLQKKESTNE